MLLSLSSFVCLNCSPPRLGFIHISNFCHSTLHTHFSIKKYNFTVKLSHETLALHTHTHTVLSHKLHNNNIQKIHIIVVTSTYIFCPIYIFGVTTRNLYIIIVQPTIVDFMDGWMVDKKRVFPTIRPCRLPPLFRVF